MQIAHIGPHILYCGDCLKALPTLAAGSVGLVVADPPYSSGGAFRGDRMMSTKSKYVNSEDIDLHTDFSGDNRDQRAYLYWSCLWIGAAQKAAKPGSPILVFTDWRQLPTTTDALQCGGAIWRGIAPWNKTEAVRPQRGRFRAQCEYLVWGSFGPMEAQVDDCLPGFYIYPTMSVNNGKQHIAEKPVELLIDVMAISKAGATVLDPFMGSGSTGVACVQTGRKFVGIELDPRYFDIACQRIEAAMRQPALFDHAELERPRPVQEALL